jgi:short-subunit dehydrogenase
MSQYYKVVITGATGGIGREIVKRLDKKSELIILVGLTKNSLDDLKRMWMGNIQHRSIFISAIKKENWEELKRAVYDIVLEIHKTRYPNYLSPSEEELVFI